jgi:hypothetical protein
LRITNFGTFDLRFRKQRLYRHEFLKGTTVLSRFAPGALLLVLVLRLRNDL